MPATRVDRSGFRHEALLYRGVAALAHSLLPFVREGISRGEPVLVALPSDRIDALRDALGDDADRASYLDITEAGANPARIIGEWRHFVDAHPGATGLRGMGELVWSGRRAVELEECRLYEALLNVAFDDGPAWQLLCPYDVDALPADVIEDVTLTHPEVRSAAGPRSDGYGGHRYAHLGFAQALAPAPVRTAHALFDGAGLGALRGQARVVCARAGLSAAATDDLVLALHEVATNSVEHGGGCGELRTWTRPDVLVFEVSDLGVIDDPLVGRQAASDLAEGGRGVWLANQLCDLVQIRSSSRGTVVRLHHWL